jgi:hypothetical protein
MVYLTLCLWEEIGLVWSGSTIATIPSTEQDGVFNIMSMGRNWSSLAWMTTIAKIPSTEQDGVFNIMFMGRNWSSLAWMTTVYGKK